jgi:uncharacterized protein (TIGR02757 family)
MPLNPSELELPDAARMRERLESLYVHYNDRKWVHPDPLETVLRYEDPRDQEVVGLIASSLAFGGVKQIITSIHGVLEPMERPYAFVTQATRATLVRRFSGFRHRYVDDADLVALLTGIQNALIEYGTLEACFAQGSRSDHNSHHEALVAFVHCLRRGGGGSENYLLSVPERGSACKRLHLFLRWMIRRDAVDPGPWSALSPKGLLVPVDTHMHRIATCLRWTSRQQADGVTSREITEACRRMSPDDPVRYDFALTRLGIRKDFTVGAFLSGTFVTPAAPMP